MVEPAFYVDADKINPGKLAKLLEQGVSLVVLQFEQHVPAVSAVCQDAVAHGLPIVYAGAIMVLFLFVIMLMNQNKQTEPQKSRWLRFVGVIGGGCLLLVLVAALRNSDIKMQEAQMNGGEIGLIKNLGNELFSTYVVPFEISSILFLSAMVGAVVIGKKE